MASPRVAARHKPTPYAAVGQLWQVPTLVVAVGLFGFAAYRFIDPHAGPSIDQKIDAARSLLKAERPEAAINALNRLEAGEKLDRDHDGTVQLLMGQSLAALQQQKHLDLKAYHEQIVEHTRLAVELGVKPTYEIERRLGESYEALGKPAEALDHYRKAAAMDPAHALRLQRKVIDLQLATGDAGPADASLERYAASTEISDGERAWALCNRAKLMVDRGRFGPARDLLDRAATLEADPGTAGQVTYYRGYCAAKTGDLAGAEALLRTARQQLRSDHPLDADAACLLGQLSADRGEYRTAAAFFTDVVANHPGSGQEPTALLGRGLARVLGGRPEDGPPGVADLTEVTRQLLAGEPTAAVTAAAADGLTRAAAALTGRHDTAAALTLLDCQRQLTPRPSAVFYHQLSAVFEARAGELAAASAGPPQTPAEIARRATDVRAATVSAADYAVAEARAETVTDDTAAGDALWRGIGLYERADELTAAIDQLNGFVADRPADPRTPRALLLLGNDYRRAGQLDRAIAAYQKNMAQHAESLAASQSAVPLAAAYAARGPAGYPQAEDVLRHVLEGNSVLTPASAEYRDALFDLGKLYYRTGQYKPAILRLTDWTGRYQDGDPRTGQALFLLADSYRRSGRQLAGEGATTRPAEGAEIASARRDRLESARVGFDAVVAYYQHAPPTTDLDRTYERLAYFGRADCLYDAGRYEDAIRLYDAAAFKYDADPAAMAAYVQIVNAYTALGKPDEARMANERAKRLLGQIPAEAFSGTMSKEYWENQLRWTGGGGMW